MKILTEKQTILLSLLMTPQSLPCKIKKLKSPGFRRRWLPAIQTFALWITPTFVHNGASITPTGAQDFSTTVTYTVTAADGSTKPYTVTTSMPPTIAGPTSMTLTTGYTATSTGVYTATGSPAPAISKTSGDASITWNNTTKTLDVAAGLAAGVYPVVLSASNSVSPNATITFTLTVNAPQPSPTQALTRLLPVRAAT